MTTADLPPLATSDEIAMDLDRVAKHLAEWVAWMRAHGRDGEPGQVMAAMRVARIVQAGVNQAVCDTLALERAAVTAEFTRTGASRYTAASSSRRNSIVSSSTTSPLRMTSVDTVGPCSNAAGSRITSEMATSMRGVSPKSGVALDSEIILSGDHTNDPTR